MVNERSSKMVSLSGALFGFASSFNIFVIRFYPDKITKLTTLWFPIAIVLAVFLGAFLFSKFHNRYLDFVISKNTEKLDSNKLRKYSRYPYLLFMSAFLGACGFQFDAVASNTLLCLFLILQFAVYRCSLASSKQEKFQTQLFVLFAISGFAALIYQIVWQRVLFTVFGVNSESVIVIVSLFMFGLGIGSLVGGFLAKKFPNNLVKLFFAFEVIIGVYGFFSHQIINFSQTWIANPTVTELVMVVYSVLFLPTLAMGATLPILVSYINKNINSVGVSVSWLYFVNTLGSSGACFLTAFILFPFLGLQNSIYVAVLLNFLVAISMVFISASTAESESL